MEKTYVDPNELQSKFRSKSDLWKRMSIDCKQLIIPIWNSGYFLAFVFKMPSQFHENDHFRREKVSIKKALD